MIAQVSDDGGGISSERAREGEKRRRRKRRRVAAYTKSKKRLRINAFNLSLEFRTPIPAAAVGSSSSATRPVLRLSPDDVEYVRSTMESHLDSELSNGQYRGGTTFDFLRLSGVGDVTYGDSRGEQEMMRRGRWLLRSVRQGEATGLRGLQEEEAVVLATTTATLTVSGGIASFLLPSSSSIPPSQDEIDVMLSEGLRNPNFREKLKSGKETEDRSSGAGAAGAAGGGGGIGVDFATVSGAGYAPLTASPTEAPTNPPTTVPTTSPTLPPSEEPAAGTAGEGLDGARFPFDDGTGEGLSGNDAGIEPARDALAAASDRGAVASDDSGGGANSAPLIGGMAAVGLAALAISYGLFAKKRQRKNGRGGGQLRKSGDSDYDDSGSLGLKSTDKLTELHALDSMRIREEDGGTVSSGDPFRGYASAGGGRRDATDFKKLCIPEDDVGNVATVRDDVVTVHDARNGKEERPNVVAVEPLDDSDEREDDADERDDETDSVASSGIASIVSGGTFGRAIQTLLGRRSGADSSSSTRDARSARTVRTKESFEEDRRTMNCAVRKDMLSSDVDAHGTAEAASPPPPIAFDREGSVLAPSFFAAADVGGEPSSEPNFVNLEFEPDPIWDPDDCDDDDVDGDDTMNSDAQSSMEVPFCEAPLTSTSYEDGMFEGSRRDRTDRIVSYQMDFVEAGGEDPQFV